MSNPQRQPWVVHFTWKLLHNDEGTLSLIRNNPFPSEPPTYIRVNYYLYAFEQPGKENVWTRTYIGEWLSPVSVDTPGLKEFIIANNWNLYEKNNL